MSVDDLNDTDRSFYESTQLKVAYSFFLGSLAVISLALCSVCAGLADSFRIASKDSGGSTEDGYVSQSAGYGNLFSSDHFVKMDFSLMLFILVRTGFAAFLFVVAFVVLLSSAIMVSPMCCGSNKERALLKMQKSPTEQSATLPAAGKTTRKKM